MKDLTFLYNVFKCLDVYQNMT